MSTSTKTVTMDAAVAKLREEFKDLDDEMLADMSRAERDMMRVYREVVRRLDATETALTAMRTAVAEMADGLRGEDLSHTDVASWVLELDAKTRATEPA